MRRFGWESGFDNLRVLREVAACRKIGSDGRVSFASYEYHFWLPVLETEVVPVSETGG